MSSSRPGDRRADTGSILRFDQAGEYGATRIYAGQLAERRVRPTALQPLWNVAGFALGAATALMSEKAALACTDAVETEIDKHYSDQLRQLGKADPELAADIADFQADELEHRDTAREAGAAQAIGYPLLTAAIRAGCRVAIRISKRI